MFFIPIHCIWVQMKFILQSMQVEVYMTCMITEVHFTFYLNFETRHHYSPLTSIWCGKLECKIYWKEPFTSSVYVDSKVFIRQLFTFSQITYNKQLHKFLIYKVKETSIKTTCKEEQCSINGMLYMLCHV